MTEFETLKKLQSSILGLPFNTQLQPKHLTELDVCLQQCGITIWDFDTVSKQYDLLHMDPIAVQWKLAHALFNPHIYTMGIKTYNTVRDLLIQKYKLKPAVIWEVVRHRYEQIVLALVSKQFPQYKICTIYADKGINIRVNGICTINHIVTGYIQKDINLFVEKITQEFTGAQVCPCETLILKRHKCCVKCGFVPSVGT